MKPVALDEVTREGNLEGHKVFMSFDEQSLAHLMKVMTDLYSDPALAVIREYSTNAFDSHVEAGTKRPIEVSLPGALSPYFKVKDYGVGLNTEDIITVYSKYGASTKRDTNTQVGMLGLGCKSALTFTNTFQVVGVKDGVKTHVMVTRDTSGVGLMDIVDASETTEPNGVEVIIPCSNFRVFNEKANDFYKYWQKGTVLVNGVEPTTVVGKEIAEGVHERIREANQYGTLNDIVVMGNVPYPVSDSHGLWPFNRRGGETTAVVATVDIGSVAITPSREALFYNDHTKATLAKIRKKISDQFQARMAADINGAADHAEALERAAKWRSIVGVYSNIQFQYKGEDIPFGKSVQGRMAYHPYRSRNAVASQGMYGSSAQYGDDFVIVNDYDYADIPTHRRVKMRKWSEDNNVSARVFLIAPAGGLPESVTKWLRNKSVSWNDMKKVSIGSGSNGKRGPKRPPHFYTVSASSGAPSNDTPLSDIAKEKKVCFYDPSVYNLKDYDLWRLAERGWTVVRLPASRVKVFETKVKKYVRFGEAIEQEAKELEALVSDEDIRRYRAQGSGNGVLQRLNVSNLDDPDLVEYTLLKTTAPSSAFQTWYSFCNAMGLTARVQTKLNSVTVKTQQDFITKYPLLESFGYTYGMTATHYRHIEFYLNEVYKKGSI